jgi:hypothetical protein
VFSYGQLGDTIQLLQGSKIRHIFLRPGDNINVVPETAGPSKLDSRACYVFTGGLGQIGTWLYSWSSRFILLVTQMLSSFA